MRIKKSPPAPPRSDKRGTKKPSNSRGSNFMSKSLRLGVGIGLLLMLSACGSTKNGSEPIVRIEIFPQQINLVPGEPAQFTAVAKTASNKTVDNVTFGWQSLDPSIAEIDANGRGTGVSVGIATLTASSGTYQ